MHDILITMLVMVFIEVWYDKALHHLQSVMPHCWHCKTQSSRVQTTDWEPKYPFQLEFDIESLL